MSVPNPQPSVLTSLVVMVFLKSHGKESTWMA